MTSPSVDGLTCCSTRHVAKLRAFGVGSITGGTAAGVGCFLVGALGAHFFVSFRLDLQVALVLLSIFYGCSAALNKTWWVPSRRWQVPRTWGFLGTPRFEFLFGFALGAGVLTLTPYIEIYLLFLVCAAFESLPYAILTMAAFGAARFLPLLLVQNYRGSDLFGLAAAVERLKRVRAPLLFALAAVTLLSLGQPLLLALR